MVANILLQRGVICFGFYYCFFVTISFFIILFIRKKSIRVTQNSLWNWPLHILCNLTMACYNSNKDVLVYIWIVCGPTIHILPVPSMCTVRLCMSKCNLLHKKSNQLKKHLGFLHKINIFTYAQLFVHFTLKIFTYCTILYYTTLL